jgi:hypothetical protein
MCCIPVLVSVLNGCGRQNVNLIDVFGVNNKDGYCGFFDWGSMCNRIGT